MPCGVHFRPTLFKKRGQKMWFPCGIFQAVIPLREKTGNYDLRADWFLRGLVIPLREKTGNYDAESQVSRLHHVIPLREKTGNYDITHMDKYTLFVIPLREKTGNYDRPGAEGQREGVIPLREKTNAFIIAAFFLSVNLKKTYPHTCTFVFQDFPFARVHVFLNFCFSGWAKKRAFLRRA